MIKKLIFSKSYTVLSKRIMITPSFSKMVKRTPVSRILRMPSCPSFWTSKFAPSSFSLPKLFSVGRVREPAWSGFAFLRFKMNPWNVSSTKCIRRGSSREKSRHRHGKRECSQKGIMFFALFSSLFERFVAVSSSILSFLGSIWEAIFLHVMNEGM